MQKFILLSHRHEKEVDELAKSFATQKPVNDSTLKKLQQTCEYDFRPNALKQILPTSIDPRNPLDKKNRKELLAFLIDDNNVCVSFVETIFIKNKALIDLMYTNPGHFRKGYNAQLLDLVEETIIEKMHCDEITAGASDVSGKIFRKRGYSVRMFDQEKLKRLNIDVVLPSDIVNDSVLTKADYYKRKQSTKGEA